MNTISITTSQNIELEYELGSLGDRIIGRILDFLVLIGYCLIIFAIIGFGNLGRFIDNNTWFIIFFIAFPVVFYDLLLEIFLNGQSFGKKIMGIKVISLNGGQASFSQYLIRWIFRIVDFSFSGSIVALVTVAASEKKQRLGDMIAGTVLVKMRPRTQISDTIFQAVPDNNYEVMYPEVINLKDQDVQLIKEVLKSVSQSGNTELALQAQQKVERVLNIQSRHYDSRSFLNAVVADYNYLTSRL
ncbi:MAG: RDD family protein [Ginsengibacter sp.]